MSPLRTYKYLSNDKHAFYITVVSFIIACAVVGFATWHLVHQTDRTSEQVAIARAEARTANKTTKQIQDALVDNCERNSNRLRHGLQQYFQSELAQQQKLGYKTYHALFPNFPPSDLRRLLREQGRRFRYDINVRFKALNCKKEFGR